MTKMMKPPCDIDMSRQNVTNSFHSYSSQGNEGLCGEGHRGVKTTVPVGNATVV